MGSLNTPSDSASFACSLTWLILLLQNFSILMHLFAEVWTDGSVLFQSHHRLTTSICGYSEGRRHFAVWTCSAMEAFQQNYGQPGLLYLLLTDQRRSTVITKRLRVTFTGSCAREQYNPIGNARIGGAPFFTSSLIEVIAVHVPLALRGFLRTALRSWNLGK